jgi:hypothetical protein
MSSVYLILGAFLFLIIVLPSANTIIAQANCDYKMNQISTNGCKEMCDMCEKTQDSEACHICFECENAK